MTAFICLLDRSGAAVDPAELQRVAPSLAVAGADLAIFCRGPVGIVVGHSGDPGARERHGPLEDSETGRVVAVAGRLRGAGVSGGTFHDTHEPAGGIARLLAGRGPKCGGPESLETSSFAELSELHRGLLAGASGPFALVAADPAAPWISIARDHLGALKVYYLLDRRWLVAASDPSAILRHGAASNDLDEASVARYLGFRFSHSERSFFQRIRELPPAHRLHVTAEEVQTEQYWRFRGACPAAEGLPEEVAGELLRRLERSVAEDVNDLAPERSAVSLSGGIDSTAVAAVAPRGVQAFSWTFREVPEGDESSDVEAVSRHLGLPVRWVPGDGLYPLAGDFAERFVHEASPYVNAFAALKARLYDVARSAGCRRILVGDGGDAVYAAREYWLRDVLLGRRSGALGSLADTIRRAGRGDPFARLSLVRLLPLRGLRSTVFRNPAPWLTPEGRALLPPVRPAPIIPEGLRRVRQDLIAGAKHIEVEAEEHHLFARCGVERVNPFWSWPVLELAIHLPADWSYRDGRTKVLSREALRGRLPDRVVAGKRAGLLGAFFLRGIELARDTIRETVFRHPRSDWQRYVRREWVEPYLDNTRSIAFGHTILWRVICYELWIRRL